MENSSINSKSIPVTIQDLKEKITRNQAKYNANLSYYENKVLHSTQPEDEKNKVYQRVLLANEDLELDKRLLEILENNFAFITCYETIMHKQLIANSRIPENWDMNITCRNNILQDFLLNPLN